MFCEKGVLMNRLIARLLCVSTIAAFSFAAAAAPTKKSPDASVRTMTAQQAFYYWVAVYGAPADLVDRYARVFDATNYKNAMADEFERARYRNQLNATIMANVDALTFAEKFVYVSPSEPHASARLGEYSFSEQAFPVVAPDTGFDYFNYWAGGNGFDVNPFALGFALNDSDFTWSLPMAEATASKFLKSLPGRRLTLRITYSVTRYKNAVSSSRYYLTPFIHSIDVFADQEMAKPAGALARNPAAPRDPHDFVARDSEAASLLMGTWRDENSVITYAPDGTRVVRLDGGGTFRDQWSVNRRALELVLFERNGKPTSESMRKVEIVELSASKMITSEGGRLWTATRVETDLSTPWLLPESRVEARYSEVARKARIEGIVIVRCTVDEEGNVVATEVVKPLPFGLDAAAVAAVRQWKFRPAQKDGQPVASTYEAAVAFRIGGQ